MDSEYKNFKCINKMSDAYKKNLYNMVNHYGNILDKGNSINKIAFTLHDFSHHCFNIYKIISQSILQDTAYEQSGLTDEELYILNLSVLFHDISMSNDLHFDRNKHSIQSADFIESEYQTKLSVLRQSEIAKNQVNALKLIIIGHSDIKGSEPRNTLEDDKLNDELPGKTEKIRGKLLAGILRLADELDITNSRIGNVDLDKEFNTDDNDEAESKRHWERLHFFKHIEENKEVPSVINLIIDDDYIMDHEDDIPNIAKGIMEVNNKIINTLNYIDDIVFSKSKIALACISIRKIEYITSNDKLLTEFKNMNANKTNLIVNSDELTLEKEDVSIKDNLKTEEILMGQVIDNTLSQDIYEWVKRDKLILSGHYLINDTYCSKDWIDMHSIIKNEEYCSAISLAINEHILRMNKINKELSNDLIIVGLDLNGMIIASRIGYNSKIPFSYIIPAKSHEENAKQVIDFDAEQYKKIILITDVIASKITINSVIKYYKIRDEQLSAIYTVLYRNPVNKMKLKLEYDFSNRIYSLNDKFDIEIFEKRKCKIREINCLASNITVN